MRLLLSLALIFGAAAITFTAWTRTSQAQEWYVVEGTGDGEELAFVRELLADLNAISIQQNVEYCGYIGIDDAGNFVQTETIKGDESSCLPPEWPNPFTAVASYHTHSAFSTEYDSEIPSSDDFLSDEEEEVDGYIATPGGRLWFLDSDTMTARQICGVGCLPMDSTFIRGDSGPIPEVISYGEVLDREGGF